MATITQYVCRPQCYPVAVFAGPNNTLLSYVEQLYLSLIAGANVQRYSASSIDVSVFWDLFSVQNTFNIPNVFIVTDVQDWPDLDFLTEYSESPYADTYLLLEASTIKRPDKKRWIPFVRSVLYVDCTGVSESSMLRFVKTTARCSKAEAQSIIDCSFGDIDEIVRLVELCEVFDNPPIDDILIKSKEIPSPLSKYGILALDGEDLFKQLRQRFIQLLSLSVSVRAGHTFQQFMNDCDLEPFQVKGLLPLAKDNSPQEWVKRLAHLARSEKWVNEPGYKRYLEMTLV